MSRGKRGLLLLGLLWSMSVHASKEPVGNTTGDWDEWMQGRADSAGAEPPAVQNRVVAKSSRFQLVGPLGGISERGDLYDHPVLSFAGRYHLSETSSWEFLRLDLEFSAESALATEIREKTSFHPDARPSKFQFSTGYLFAPVYGKYAWSADHVVHFDAYGMIGPGVRIPTEGAWQPYAYAGLGMNHFVYAQRLSIVPELRVRVYREVRSGATTVWESIFQLGTAFLL